VRECRKCGTSKPLDEYYQNKQTGRPSGYTCKECTKQAVRGRLERIAHQVPELQRGYDLKRRYGITADEYDRLLLKQGGACAICDGPPGGKGKYFHVDHCHGSGAIRGLLCNNCNRGLGQLRERAEIVRAAIAYLGGAA
jgi:hypothetical protein